MKKTSKNARRKGRNPSTSAALSISGKLKKGYRYAKGGRIVKAKKA